MPENQNEVPKEASVSFPQTRIQVNQQGMQVFFLLAPGLTLQQVIDVPTMHEIARLWKEASREIQKQQEIIQHVMQTKQ